MQHITERNELKAQINDLLSEMDNISPEKIKTDLLNKLKDAVFIDPNSAATKKAGQALQAAQAGTDAASLERQLLSARHATLAERLAIVEREIADGERQIAASQKAYLDTLLTDAHDTFSNAVDEAYRAHIFLSVVATERFQHDADLREVDNLNWCAIPDQFAVTVPVGSSGLPEGAGVRHRMHSAAIINAQKSKLVDLFKSKGW